MPAIRHLPSALAMLSAAVTVVGLGASVSAAELTAGPVDYDAVVGTLAPGDTLRLEPGRYTRLLSLSDLNGTEEAPITITGPETGDPAVFEADSGPCCSTVDLVNSSHVRLAHVTVDGRGVAGAIGVSASGGETNRVHHITIEDCTFLGHDGSQQTVAISTKTPTWGWIIRGNRIVGVGVGIDLGSSDGTMPFVAGLIEHNLVEGALGYDLLIRWQTDRPAIDGMPAEPSRTIIRHNVFMKDDRSSPDGDRPNVLVDGFPQSGPGSQDLYEIYGNFFYHNPRESLLQASGRVSIHDNLFVDVPGCAVLLENHDLPLAVAHVYNNTIYAAGMGVYFSNLPTDGALIGNLIFSESPIGGEAVPQSGNVTDTTAAAGAYVTAPATTLGAMDFYPLSGQCQGEPLDLAAFAAETDYDRDFNGTAKGDLGFRGAYAGEGQNPGWVPTNDVKPRGQADDDPGDSDDGGCGCRVAGHAAGGAPARGWAFLAIGMLAALSLTRARPRARPGQWVGSQHLVERDDGAPGGAYRHRTGR